MSHDWPFFHTHLGDVAMRHMLHRLLVAALIAVTFTGLARAQNTLTLEGSVKGDAGPLGAATVTVVNVATQESAKTVSRPSGEFRLIGLFTGQYQVTVRAIGYKPGAQTVQLVIGQHTRLDFT